MKYLLVKNIENQIGGKKMKKKHIKENKHKLSYNKMYIKYI
jgi:hypothetical protein